MELSVEGDTRRLSLTDAHGHPEAGMSAFFWGLHVAVAGVERVDKDAGHVTFRRPHDQAGPIVVTVDDESVTFANPG